MKTFLKYFLAGVIASFSVATVQNASADIDRVEIGTLTCKVKGQRGFIFGSTKSLACTYNPLGSSPREYYSGSIREYGLDLGITKKAVFVWAVLAGSSSVPEGAFNGKYRGIGAKASIGAGVGLKLLVGGSDKTIALQPVSVQAQTGFNIALTVERLQLKSTGLEGQTGEVSTEGSQAHKLCGATIIYAPGDSLESIAARCGITIDILLEANPHISNVNEIKVGERIQTPSYPMPSGESHCGLNIIAQEGDSFKKIAKRCRVSLGALVNENPKISYRSPIRAGDKISIPAYLTPLSRRSCGSSVRLGGQGTPFSSLSDVAEICGTSVDALLSANPNIKNVRNLRKGQTIMVPELPRPVAQNVCGTHTIARKNETIYTIALRCKTTAGAIIDLNEHLGDYDKIPEGQTIKIARYTIPAKK